MEMEAPPTCVDGCGGGGAPTSMAELVVVNDGGSPGELTVILKYDGVHLSVRVV